MPKILMNIQSQSQSQTQRQSQVRVQSLFNLNGRGNRLSLSGIIQNTSNNRGNGGCRSCGGR